MSKLKNTIINILEKDVEGLDFDKKNRLILLVFISVITTLTLLIYSALSFIYKKPEAGVILLISCLLSLIGFILIKKNKKIDLTGYYYLALTAAVLIYCLCTAGIFSQEYLLIFIFPPIAISVKGIRVGSRLSLLFLFISVSILFSSLYIKSVYQYSVSASIKIVSVYFAIHSITYLYEYIKIIRFKDLNNSLNEIKQENSRKDEFISKLSHQIRTPLNNITLISNLIQRSNLNEDQQDLFNTIMASTNNLVNVVNNIVKVSSAELKEQTTNKISFELIPTIENTLKLFKNQQKDRLEYSVSTKGIKTNLIGDPIRIKQVFLNIVENLIKLKYDTKLNIIINVSVIKQTEKNIWIGFEIIAPPSKLIRDENDNFFISVAANENITEENIYLDFTIARKIIEMYDGALKIEPLSNKLMLNFSIKLKKDIQTITEIKESEEEEAPILQPLKTVNLEDANILLVEDNAINQKIVILSLKNKVKNVDVANNGKEALDKFGTTKYDIILMDIQMPVMNGIIATKKIRELEESTNTHTPIIAITANALTGDKESCLAAGMNEYISKPFQVEILLQKMKNLLEAV